MILDYAFAFISTVVMLVAMALSPARSSCPAGWWAPEGVRRDGSFYCRPVPPVRECKTPRGGWADCSEQPPGLVLGRVYCTGGRRPVPDVDGVAVGCQ